MLVKLMTKIIPCGISQLNNLLASITHYYYQTQNMRINILTIKIEIRWGLFGRAFRHPPGKTSEMTRNSSLILLEKSIIEETAVV